MKAENDGHTINYGCTRNGHQKLGKGTEEMEIGGQAEAIQTTELLRLAQILKRVLET